ncbi:hypothetical protein BT69DRAFT_1072327 [Atractiella rhizophila]|nr:hypothetical protein BT69DRAFT_1072327 [Atractiella rhizophila]
MTMHTNCIQTVLLTSSNYTIIFSSNSVTDNGLFEVVSILLDAHSKRDAVEARGVHLEPAPKPRSFLTKLLLGSNDISLSSYIATLSGPIALASYLGDTLSNPRSPLAFLSLNTNTVSVPHLQTFFEHLDTSPFSTNHQWTSNLTSLHLSALSLPPSFARDLASFLSSPRSFSLTELYLNGNNFGEYGVRCIVRSVVEREGGLERLELNASDEIKVSDNGINDDEATRRLTEEDMRLRRENGERAFDTRVFGWKFEPHDEEEGLIDEYKGKWKEKLAEALRNNQSSNARIRAVSLKLLPYVRTLRNPMREKIFDDKMREVLVQTIHSGKPLEHPQILHSSGSSTPSLASSHTPVLSSNDKLTYFPFVRLPIEVRELVIVHLGYLFDKELASGTGEVGGIPIVQRRSKTPVSVASSPSPLSRSPVDTAFLESKYFQSHPYSGADTPTKQSVAWREHPLSERQLTRLFLYGNSKESLKEEMELEAEGLMAGEKYRARTNFLRFVGTTRRDFV